MTAPVIRQFLGTIPDKGQAQTAFDTNVDAFLDWQALQFAPDLVAFGTFASSTAAALVAANLPSLTGNELDAVRVNAAGDGVEFVDVTAAGWTFLAAADAAAQRTALGVAVDSADADLAVDPDGAARRDIVAAAIAAAPGRLRFIRSVTNGSAVANIEIPLETTGYARQEVFYREVIPASNAVTFAVQVQALNNTWRTTGYVGRGSFGTNDAAITTGGVIGVSIAGAATSPGLCGHLAIEGLGAGKKTTLMTTYAINQHSNGFTYSFSYSTRYDTAEANKAIRIIASTGNIEAGAIFELWGEPT